MNLYLFDFDGTISRSDSMYQFIFFIKNKGKLALNLFCNLHNFFKYFLGIISRDKLKELLLKEIFQEFTKDQLNVYSKNFCEKFQASIKDQAKKDIASLKESKQEVCIVTASMDIWMEELAKKMYVKLICTESVFRDKKFFSFKNSNCNGEEKAKRIMKKYDLASFDTIYAYGDTSGDKEMLKLAHKSFFKFYK